VALGLGNDETQRVGVSDEAKPAVPFVAGLGSLAAVFAAAGVIDGVVGRMVGETPVLFGLALFLPVLAGFLTAFAALVTKSKLLELISLIASNVLLLAGLAFGVVGAVKVWSDTRLPSVAASSERTAKGTFLNVTVKDSGLDSSEHVTLLVEPLVYGNRRFGSDPSKLYPQGAIYAASLGSDDDGKLNHSARVRLPAGFSGHVGARAYLGKLPRGCYERADATDGCVSEAVLADREPPQLAVHWRHGGRQLQIRVSARGIGRARLRLAAFAMRSHGKRRWREIAMWDLPASASGDFVREFVADRLRNAPAVCVVASTAGRQTCPPSAKRRARDTAWVRYRRPGG
jgi:hypothetical protein